MEFEINNTVIHLPKNKLSRLCSIRIELEQEPDLEKLSVDRIEDEWLTTHHNRYSSFQGVT